jgi:hypothetical protein
MVPRGAVSLEGPACVPSSLLSLPSAPLFSRAVLAFLGVRVPNPRPCRLNSTAGTTPPHMIRYPDRTHMRGDTGTHTALVHATLMRVHIARAVNAPRVTNRKRPGVSLN